MDFEKIKVRGKIHAGTQRELVQTMQQTRARPSGEKQQNFMTAAHGPAHKQDGTNPDELGGIGSILEFSLEETKNELYIEDDGLVTSFGIFGAPGCGKTVLLNHLLSQVLASSPNDPDRRFGALILDPKAGLVEDVRAMAAIAKREDDLRIIGTGDIVNVIDCDLDPHELGSILVLAGLSAGNSASDPFWFQEWSNLFGAALSVLRLANRISPGLDGERPVTLRSLLNAIFERDGNRRHIQTIAHGLLENEEFLKRDFGGDLVYDLGIEARNLDRFFSTDYTGTVEALITRSFGMFQRSRLSNYSNSAPRKPGECPFYEDIIENGRIVLVSIPPSEPVLAKTLCTIVKCLFQRTVLARGVSKRIKNKVRPLVMACDEYSEIASEVPGQSMGDGQFLALSRQYGCMAILATQSVNVLEASSLRESWKSVFSNFAAKIYMRLADNETAESAMNLAGESDWRVTSQGKSIGEQGHSASRQKDLRSRKNLPAAILTQRLKRGEAVVVGALDGGEAPPGTRFMKVPYPPAYKATVQAPATRPARRA